MHSIEWRRKFGQGTHLGAAWYLLNEGKSSLCEKKTWVYNRHKSVICV